MRRKNGLQWPLDPHQVGSFVVFGFLVAGCYAFFVPFVPDLTARYVLAALYAVIVCFVFALAYFTSASDPSDPGLQGGNSGEYYCALCTASVGKTSKHCRSCDRCVEGFDHHCKWLNNCIGEKNYRTFFWLICLTVTMLLFQFGWAVYLFSRSFYDSSTMKALVQSNYYYENIEYQGWQAVLGIYLALLVGALLMLGELLFFHVVLVYKDMTTYDYIMAQNAGSSALASAAVGWGGGSGARAALCRSTRVADESSISVAPKRPKVSLNPCKALHTEKLQGDPRSWGSGAKPTTLGSNSVVESKAQQQGSAISMAALGMVSNPKHVDLSSHGLTGHHQDCAACPAQPISTLASSQLQSGAGYYPVVSEPGAEVVRGGTQHQIMGYPGPHQPLGESTLNLSQRQPYPYPPSSYATHSSPIKASAALSIPSRSPLNGNACALSPMHSSPVGGRLRHISTRAAALADGSFPSFRGAVSPTTSTSQRPVGTSHFVPSAASGRYSYDGQQAGVLNVSTLGDVLGKGGIRLTPLTSPQGDWRPRRPPA